jgi:hypothetical protein
MKHLKTFMLSLVVVSVCSCYLSCTRDFPQVAPLDTNFSNSSTIQVFNATLKATTNFVYADGVLVSGVTFGFGGVFPGTAYAFKVSAGAHTFLIKDTAAATKQTPLSFSQTLDAGKNYTIFTYDTITSVKQSTVVTNIVVPKDTTSMLRFANFIFNTTPVPNVDVYSYRKGVTTPVFTNVATAQVTDFIPYQSGLTDTLYVYATGTTSPLLVKQLIPIPTPTRSYTAVYNGSYKVTKAISTFANY